MVLGAQISFTTTSFPGFHGGTQCGICHNEPAVAWNPQYADESITLDGEATEVFWTLEDDRVMYIPIVTGFGFAQNYIDENGTEIEVRNYVRLQVAQNATHIFFYVRLYDLMVEGSDTYNAAGADGFALLFNIDQDEFKLPDAQGNFGSGNPWDNWEPMDGDNLEGGRQDLVFWQPQASATGISDPLWNATSGEFDDNTPVPGYVWDKNYGGTLVESSDWQAGAIHGNIANHYENDYAIELVRLLVTEDDNDVQFTYDGYYEFAVAYWNASNGAAHWVSFEHTLWVHGAYGFNPEGYVTYTETVNMVWEQTETETQIRTVTVVDEPESDTSVDTVNVSLNFVNIFTGLICIAFVFLRRNNRL
jgi:hypothetical protein